MADRQLFQLTARTPALTDVIGTQDAAGVAEQGKSTLDAVKTLLFTGVGMSPAKRVVIRFTFITSVFSNMAVMESEIPGLTISSMTRSATDRFSITMSANIFVDPSKINFQLNTMGTLFVRPEIIASNRFDLVMAEHDGTPPPALPNPFGYDFVNYFITMLFYP
jgi:hypothetical protein